MEEEIVLGCDEGDVPELWVEMFEDADRLLGVGEEPVFSKRGKEEQGEVSLLPDREKRQDPKTAGLQPIRLRQ